MPKVKGKYRHTEYVQPYVPQFLVGCGDHLVEILDFSSVVQGGGNATPMHLVPELTHVDDEENKNKGPQNTHVAGTPGRGFTFYGILLRPPRSPVFGREQNRPDNV